MSTSHLRTRKDNYQRLVRGQALVETAIAVVILTLLLMAAVDAGLAYRSYQTLTNATAEASSYLAQNPLAWDATIPAYTMAEADKIARQGLKEEQAGSRIGTSAIPDSAIVISEADSSQVSTGTGGVYGLDSSFTRTSNTECQERRNFDGGGDPCFIVIKSSLVYRPFMLTLVFGQEMTIRVTSVKPIVGHPGETD